MHDRTSIARNAAHLVKVSARSCMLAAGGAMAADAPSPPASAPTVTVQAPRAWLFDVPELSAPSHNWLDRGTPVRVLDATRDPAWVKIRYAGPAGRPVERWVHRADLAMPG